MDFRKMLVSLNKGRLNENMFLSELKSGSYTFYFEYRMPHKFLFSCDPSVNALNMENSIFWGEYPEEVKMIVYTKAEESNGIKTSYF